MFFRNFPVVMSLCLALALVPVTASAADKQTVLHVQAALAKLGLDPGPKDGSWGGKTRRALNAYRAARGLPEHSRISASSLYMLHRAHASDATLPNPGEITRGLSIRSEYLEANLPVSLRHCTYPLDRPTVQAKWMPVQSFTGERVTGGSGGYIATEHEWSSALSQAVMVSSSQCLVGDQGACRKVWDFVYRFAEEDGLQTPVKRSKRSQEFDEIAWIGNTVLSSLIAGAAISAPRLDLTMSEKGLALDWLHDRVNHFNVVQDRRARRGTPDAQAQHRSMAAALPSMLLGAWIGDRALFDRGRPQYERALASLTSHGRFPAETRRGSMALAFTGMQISYLTAMAEVARAQDEDFYALASREGRTLHDAVAFAIDGWKDWNGVVLPFARENHAAPKTPVSPMATAFDSYFGWLPAYESRFPYHRNIWSMKGGKLDKAICSKAHIKDGRSPEWWCRGTTPPLTFKQMLQPGGRKIPIASHHMGFNAGCLVSTRDTVLGR